MYTQRNMGQTQRVGPAYKVQWGKVMNKDDVIRMALEALWPKQQILNDLPEISRFAALVAAAERNRTWTQDHWTEYERSIAAAEREACAMECWKQMGMIPMQPWTVNPYEECAKAIRARGQL